ncbi:MAG: carboxypeptidase regulatory-like domain-containing protein [Gemmatimonadaceae bacterium]|nr:carboxypeptidase regulatory-like domain-containing protein [Gemmatimonadaceae bacterium]
MSLAARGALVAGGLLLAASLARAQGLGRVQGVVYDSVASRPLARASIVLTSVRDTTRARTIEADSLGRFTADSLERGPWVAAAHHPRLDSLALRELLVPFDVRDGRRTRISLAIPSARALAQRICGVNQTWRDSSGFVVGTLRRATADRTPLQGTVRVQWIDLVLSGTKPSRELMTVDATTDASGRYIACGVPVNATVLVRAASGVDSSGRAQLRIPPSGVRYRDVFIGSGMGRLTGTVRGENGRALANARVVMLASGREARADSLGRFVLDQVPAGTQALDIRAMGYEALSDAVDVLDGAPAASLELTRLLSLDTVRVRAQRSRALSGRAAGYEARKKMGFGRFYDGDQIDRLNLLRISDLFAQVPGITMVTNQRGERIPTMRGTDFRGRCVPEVLVDGFPFPLDAALDAFIQPMNVVGVEVYSSAFAPAELSRPFAPCGVIGIWTGVRPEAPARGR